MNKQLELISSRIDLLESNRSILPNNYINYNDSKINLNKQSDSIEIKSIIQQELSPYLNLFKKDLKNLIENIQFEKNEIDNIKADLLLQRQEIEENKHKIYSIERDQEDKIQTIEIYINKLQINQERQDHEIKDVFNKLSINSQDTKNTLLDDMYNKLNENISQLKKEQCYYSDDLSNIENQCEINFKNYNDKFKEMENKLQDYKHNNQIITEISYNIEKSNNKITILESSNNIKAKTMEDQEISDLAIRINENEQKYENLVLVMKSIEKKLISIKNKEIENLVNFCNKLKEDFKQSEAEIQIKNDIIIKMGEQFEELRLKIDDKQKEQNVVESIGVNHPLVNLSLKELKDSCTNQTQICIIIVSKIDSIQQRIDIIERALKIDNKNNEETNRELDEMLNDTMSLEEGL